jgi:hypothetical protein
MTEEEEVPTKEFCETNPMDERCSCYNVVYLDCKEHSTFPGCDKAMEWVETTLEAVPDTQGPHKAVARLELMERLYCPARVCVGANKYKPKILDDLRDYSPCSFKLDICLQDVNVGGAVDSEIFAECAQNTNFIGSDPWELEFDDTEEIKQSATYMQNAEIIIEAKEDQKKMIIGGVVACIIILVLVSIVLSTSKAKPVPIQPTVFPNTI